MSETPTLPSRDAEPATGGRRLVRPGLVRPALVGGLLVAVVALAGIVVGMRHDDAGVRVVEAELAMVDRASPVFGDEPGRPREREVSWVAVVENARPGRTASDVELRVELLDEDGEQVMTFAAEVALLGPQRRTAVTGRWRDLEPEEVSEVEVTVVRVGGWEDVDDLPTIEIREIEVAYGSAQEPIVTFEMSSDAGSGTRTPVVNIVYRDHDGRVLAGHLHRWRATDPPLAPQEPQRLAVAADFVVPGLATVEVYADPAVHPPS